MSIMTTTKQALDQLSADIRDLVIEWEAKNGIELTDINLGRFDSLNHLGEKPYS